MRRLSKQSGILSEPKVETPTFIPQFKPGDTVLVKGTTKVGTVEKYLDNERVRVKFPKGSIETHQSNLQKADGKGFSFTSIFDLGLFKTAKKKKDWDPNPWAVCHTTVDKDENPAKYERCVKDVKKKQASGERKDKTPGGLADDSQPSDFDSKSIEKGVKVEMEHTDDKDLAKEIAMDHLEEHPKYYDEDFLPKMEDKLKKDEKDEKEEKDATIYFDLTKKGKCHYTE